MGAKGSTPMNVRKIPLLLSSLFLLASCSSSPATPSASSLESSPLPTISSEEEPEFDTTKPSHDGLPYVKNLDSLKKHAFQGRWIWESRDIADTHVAFRRHIDLAKAPANATLHISCESKATVWINGEVIAIDVTLKRGPTPVDGFYQDIDVAKYLKQGDNLLVILVHYWGKSGNAAINPQKGGLIYDLEADGKVFSSGTTTKVKRLQEYRNIRVLSQTGEYPERERSTFLNETEIYYDARLQEQYASVSYDDSSWEDASEIALPDCNPFGALYLGDIPGFTYEELLDCVDLDEVLNKKITSPTTAHFALPENMQFLPYFELEAEEEGKRISFYTNTYRTQGIVSLMDDYVTKKGPNAYQQLYWRSGYQLILDLPVGVTLKKVGYRRTQYGADDAGHFTSSDAMLDTLWKKSASTLRICMRDTFMDCPERERSPYSGDSANQIANCFYAMDEGGWKMVKKTYLTLAGYAKEGGIFQLRWPSEKVNECPMQNLAFCLTLEDYLHHTGDIETTRLTYPILADYVKLWDLNADGSVKYRDGTFQWTDWGSGMDNELMENGWYYWAISSLNRLGKEIGNESYQSFFEPRLTQIKAAFAGKFRKEGGFSSGSIYDDRGNALAVLSGLAEESDYELVKNVLLTVHNASPYMERFVLEALGKIGDDEALLSRMKERYQGMAEFEASTLWEVWSSKPEDGTINHGWAGGPMLAIDKYLVGIVPSSAGFGSYDLRPSALLSSFDAGVMTPQGELSVALSGSTMTIKAVNGGSLYLEEGFGEVSSIEGSIAESDGHYVLSKGTATIHFVH